MQKLNIRLHMKSGEVIECYYASRLKSYPGVLREIYSTQNVQGFIRKNSTKKGAIYVVMREVAAVEIYEA